MDGPVADVWFMPSPWVGLVAVRLWALVRVQVVFRRAVASPVTWECVALTLAGVMALTLVSRDGGADSLTLDSWALLACVEFLLGTCVGLCVSLGGHALVGAARQSSALVGGASPTGLAPLMIALTAALGLELGLHRPLLLALADTVELWPPGQPAQWLPDGGAAAWGAIVCAAHDMLVLALAFASPVLLSVVVTDVVVGLVGAGPRSVHGALDSARPWLCTALALVALAAAWDAYPEAWGRALQLPS